MCECRGGKEARTEEGVAANVAMGSCDGRGGVVVMYWCSSVHQQRSVAVIHQQQNGTTAANYGDDAEIERPIGASSTIVAMLSMAARARRDPGSSMH